MVPADDALAVQPVAVAHARLDGMAEGVAQVEQGALAGLPLVRRHHFRLVLAGAADGVGEGVRVPRHQLVHVAFQPFQEGRVADQAVLDDLGQTGGQFPVRQGVQGFGIGQHQLRLVEGADHVLAEGMVDAGLAAHGGIHLGQQGGGHLDEGHAALVAGRREAGEIADDAAARGRPGWSCARRAGRAGRRRSGSAFPSSCRPRRPAARPLPPPRRRPPGSGAGGPDTAGRRWCW
jgi:hypothetical protein